MSAKTSIEEKKLALIQWLSAIDDPQIIEKVMALKQLEQADWWENLSEQEKAAIEKGLQDADAGKLIAQAEAKKRYEKWL